MTQLMTAPTPPRTAQAVPSAALALTRAVIETMTGRRSLHQLEMCVGLEVYDIVAAHARRGRLRAARATSVRAQMPHPGAI
ncbi:Rv3235 family protein, partial [Bacillus cereus group sp. Bce002]|uniref:Rv3235 family protein n=1 Tax=Bacillus cereus group sp. Bce002 TaxID=3445259 RepID=UPI003F26D2F7